MNRRGFLKFLGIAPIAAQAAASAKDVPILTTTEWEWSQDGPRHVDLTDDELVTMAPGFDEIQD